MMILTRLLNKCKYTYKLYLVGDYLCQFHVDWPQKRYTEVYSIEGLLLWENTILTCYDMLVIMIRNIKSMTALQ